MSKALANKKRIFRYQVEEPHGFSEIFTDVKGSGTKQTEQSYTSVKESSSPHVSKILIAVILAAALVVGVTVTLAIVLSSKDESKDDQLPQSTEYPNIGSPATTTTPIEGNQTFDWSEWEEWTQCSATCGTGIYRRYRHCNEELSSLCLGEYIETELCSEIDCPVYGKWTTWSSWGSCTVTCGGGSHTRTRNCNKNNDIERDCTGNNLQTTTCSNWRCPDCNQSCTVGALNDRCDTCVCASNSVMGRIIAKATNNPIRGAALYAQTAPTQLLALSNSTGFFSLNSTCTGSELYITKEGFMDSVVTVNDTYMQIYMTRIVKPYITESPQSKYRLSDENVTLCCMASANPEITYYEWFKDNILLDSKLYLDGTMIVLSNLNVSDSGNYQCRANSEAGAIISPAAALTVKDEPDDFCSDALQQKTIQLPIECMQPGTNTSAFEVGDCSATKCRQNITAEKETCRESINSCCTVKEYKVETINCTGYELDLFVVKSCSCAECAPPEVLISGVANGLEDETPVKLASIYLNGDLKGLTSITGTFEFTVNSTSSRLTIKIEDDFFKEFLPTSKVIDISDDIRGTINLEIKMLKAADPIYIDSTIVNTLTTDSPLGSNVSNVLLEIPANSFYYKNGSLFSGTVSARLTFLDPSNISNIENIPGLFQFIDNEGQTGDLESLGVFSLYFEDQSGQPLTLNQDIDAYIPRGNEGNETYENIKLWTLNLETGIWELEDENTEAGRRKRQTNEAWIGSVTDVSERKWYNYDQVSLLSQNLCYFKIQLFKNRSQKEAINKPENCIETRTNIFRGRVLHTITYCIWSPTSSCINVPCDSEIAYITGKTSSRNLYVGKPYPFVDVYYQISTDKKILKTKLTSKSNGPFHSSCDAATDFKSHLSFSNGITTYDWKFIDSFSTCTPERFVQDPSIRQRVWYPSEPRETIFRVCFVKIKIHFQPGISINKDHIKLRVFSFGGNNNEIKDLILGIHESNVDNSETYCIEYRCSGFIDVCNGNVFDKTKVNIYVQYPMKDLRCNVDDEASDLAEKSYTNYYNQYYYYSLYSFYAPFEDGGDNLGIYTYVTKSSFDIPRARYNAERYCLDGTLNPHVNSKANLGYAVSFYCHKQ